MDAIRTSSIVLACIFGSALCGMYLRSVLPNAHLGTDSKDSLKLSLGVMATIASVSLAMLLASARGFYDTQTAEVVELSDQVILLNRTLARFGPETKGARDILRAAVADALEQTWSTGRGRGTRLEPGSMVDSFYDVILKLPDTDDAKRGLKAQALNIAASMGHLRWLMFEQTTVAFPRTLLIVLVTWLCIIFLGFGLLSPRNATVIGSLFISVSTVSGAFLVILEMYRPYQGLIQVSSDPVREALAHLTR